MHIIKSNNAYYYYNSRNHIPLALAHPDTNLNEHEHRQRQFFLNFLHTLHEKILVSHTVQQFELDRIVSSWI